MNEQTPEVMIQLSLVELAFNAVGIVLNVGFVIFTSLLTQVFTQFFAFFQQTFGL